MDAVCSVPKDRWNVDWAIENGLTSDCGGFLSPSNQVALFDHTFFGVSHREACVTDPQQRLLLQVRPRMHLNLRYLYLSVIRSLMKHLKEHVYWVDQLV